MTDRIITTEEAAQMLGASEATVRRYIDKQLIKGERIGVEKGARGGGPYKISRNSVLGLIGGLTSE